jgi:acyl-CoA reductase-like NAD-dependent aldehyde dehydrogenase
VHLADPLLVHESIRNDFAAALARHAQSLKVGDGLAEGTQMGPLANPRRIVAMAGMLEDAVQRGATVATGGARIGEAGNFFAPTVLTDVPLDARCSTTSPSARWRRSAASTRSKKPSPRPTACPTASPPTPSPAR